MRFPRSSGLLLHPTSLPGPYGIGEIGPSAFEFIDYAVEAGQTLWQVLPLTPTGYGDSPYQSTSAFAGNILLIDPRALVTEGLLEESDLSAAFADTARVDFNAVRSAKTELLNRAFARFRNEKPQSMAAQFDEFCVRSAWWLDDFALFNAAKAASGNREWTAWDRALAFRDE